MSISLVLDTNVLISGYLWNGKPRKLLKLVKTGNFTILYSRETISEFAFLAATKIHSYRATFNPHTHTA